MGGPGVRPARRRLAGPGSRNRLGKEWSELDISGHGTWGG
jgi:hypothetical protein